MANVKSVRLQPPGFPVSLPVVGALDVFVNSAAEVFLVRFPVAARFLFSPLGEVA